MRRRVSLARALGYDSEVLLLDEPLRELDADTAAAMLALIDRSVMVYPRIEKKEFYYIMTMADTETENFRGTIEALRGFVLCCEESQEKGMICAEGVYQKGEILEHAAMTQAYEMGKNV